MASNDPDDKLVSKARSGDRTAFGKLATKYYEMVYVVCYGILRNREAARDVVQDTLLKAYRDIHKFEGRSKFKSWLYRIGINTAIDHQRRVKPADPVDPTDRAEETGEMPRVIADPKRGPRDQAVQRELGELFAKVLDQLSPEHRAVLVLREWEGLSYEEIAASLGVETGTVMSRLYYARKKLAGVFEKDYGKVSREWSC